MENIEIPKFIFGENYDLVEDIFVIHTQFPRFIYSDYNDTVTFIDTKDDDGFPITEYENEDLINEAINFLESEIIKWEDDEFFDDEFFESENLNSNDCKIRDWTKGFKPNELN